MPGFCVLRSRLTGTLTTADDTDHTTGMDAFSSTTQHRPDAVARAASEADVVETVRFARDEVSPLQLHATGQRTTAPSGHCGRPHQPGSARSASPSAPPRPPSRVTPDHHLRLRNRSR